MKQNKASRNKKRIQDNFLGMAVITFVVFVLLGILTYRSRVLSEKLEFYKNRAVVLESAIEEEEERTKEIDELREYMKTDAFAEEIAREKLGLVKDNEIVFIEAN